MLKTLSTNKLTNHPAYPKIIASYSELLKRDGKVNAKKFYETVILPEIPDYDMGSWYYFLKRFKTSVGIMPANARNDGPGSAVTAPAELEKVLLENKDATNRALALALNISVEALQDIIDDPSLVPAEKRAELFLKVMKAQDSRVKAVGTIRADNREQEKFERAMESAAFS